MGTDLRGFKVVYGNRVLMAVSLQYVEYKENQDFKEQYKTPKFIEVLVINEDGNIMAIHDEAWTFQFIPIINQSIR